MKAKRTVSIICLLSAILLLLSSCGSGGDPVTDIELGFTEAQAMEKEPTLSDYDEYQLYCDKTYAGADGGLLVYINSPDGEPTVRSIKWIAEPTDGTGRETYDALFAALKKCCGKPDSSKDAIETGVTGTAEVAQARWIFKDYAVSVSYIHYPETGKCQIIYNKSVK